ncbi:MULTISPECIES: hypothetical protein [unclassified Exiguobacterium]|uniref:hypothetical protein n=1 Tax=unclassified Exiguobacterium TaxID=2644629 RepID=UPI001BEB4C44|nr:MULTISPECIES: hypothetical protein [unclassified Exiguobacterium]
MTRLSLVNHRLGFDCRHRFRSRGIRYDGGDTFTDRTTDGGDRGREKLDEQEGTLTVYRITARYVGVSARAIYAMTYGIRTSEGGTGYCLDLGQGCLSGCLCPHLNQEKRAARFQEYLPQMNYAIGLPDNTAYIQSETDHYRLGEGYVLCFK